MALVAPASKTVRNKNFIMIILCAVFTAWFSYDGWVGWPAGNDGVVHKMAAEAESSRLYSEEDKTVLAGWPGWDQAGAAQRESMATFAQSHGRESSWHTDTAITFQKWIVLVLALATAASIWWFIKCQGRRATADEEGLSPQPGVSIPWSSITKVDNTLWKKKGIVDLEYQDGAGQTQPAVLDDYLLDNLLPILDMLSERADKAEFINPGAAAKADEAPDSSKPSE